MRTIIIIIKHIHSRRRAWKEAAYRNNIKFKQGALPSAAAAAAAAERQNSHTALTWQWPPEFSKRRLLWSGLERFCLFLTCICSRRVNGADEWLYCSVIQRECDMHTHTHHGL